MEDYIEAVGLMNQKEAEKTFHQAFEHFKFLIHYCNRYENVAKAAEEMIHANDEFKKDPKWHDAMWANIWANLGDVTTH